MKKTAAAVILAIFSAFLYSQVNLVDTAREEGKTIRSAQSGFAEDEFRRGVQSFYRGAFNESILQFEKALSYLPGENLILEWLGKAYYYSGIEGAAIQQWQAASDAGYGGILLQNKIETVSERRFLQSDYYVKQKYTESGEIPYLNENSIIYSQPISVLPEKDGSVWVVSYATNEILCFDVNANVTKKLKGPLNGFDRPSDIIRLSDGRLLVSEFAGDRLSLLDSNGKFIKYIGEKGINEGQLLGPQYLAEDSFGNIYVTDFGNARVSVFDPDGKILLTFGKKSAEFNGFVSPTGIAVYEDRVFVADSVKGAVYEFDRAGNYKGLLVNEKTFARPETMKIWKNSIILTDVNKVITVDIDSGAVFENASTGKAPSNLTCAVPDANGNLVVTDFKNNEIYVMTKMSELVGGLFVQVERVYAENFPQVIIEVKVESRNRQGIVGLKAENFYITEGKRPVTGQALLGHANYNDFADITVLIDRNINMKAYEEQIQSAVREIASSMNGKGTVRIVSSGKIPVLEFTGSPLNLSDFSVKALKTPYSSYAALDLAIRLSANDLINGEKKRAVIYLTDGQISQNAFSKYALSDLSACLNNNSIAFCTLNVKEGALSDEINYITEYTQGTSYYIYRPEGISSIVSDIIDIPSGLYQFSYTSTLPKEYGRKYLPVEIETYVLNRSGRDETGYFAPLE